MLNVNDIKMILVTHLVKTLDIYSVFSYSVFDAMIIM